MVFTARHSRRRRRHSLSSGDRGGGGGWRAHTLYYFFFIFSCHARVPLTTPRAIFICEKIKFFNFTRGRGGVEFVSTIWIRFIRLPNALSTIDDEQDYLFGSGKRDCRREFLLIRAVFRFSFRSYRNRCSGGAEYRIPVWGGGNEIFLKGNKWFVFVTFRGKRRWNVFPVTPNPSCSTTNGVCERARHAVVIVSVGLTYITWRDRLETIDIVFEKKKIWRYATVRV